MNNNQTITLTRDVDAILIPVGTPISLPRDSEVTITQALGGNYTVNVNGNLVQIAAQNADALGFDAPEPLQPKPGSEDNGEVDEDQVWQQLRTCYDPEIPVNMVDLGLIYGCSITRLEDGGNRVDIVMTLTAPGCGMGDFLAADVKQKVAMVPNVSDVNVELTFDPPWDQSMMSETARLETGMYY
ncbi:MAG: putative Fe-S cluster assembly protein SufT [Gammaproteobacteria bacterium]